VVTLGRIDSRAAVLAVLLATVAPVARADPLRASLVVTRGEGAEDCPDTGGVVARVREITGADTVSAPDGEPRETWVQVELVRELSGYRAVIAARGRRQGTRSIEDIGPGCSSLADALAITLVMLLDPDVQPEVKPAPAPVPPRPDPLPPQPAQPKDSVAPATRSETPAARRTGVRFGGEANFGGSMGILAHAVPLVEAGARVGVGSILSFGGGGGILFSDEITAPGGSVDLGLAYGYLRACAEVFENAGSELSLCLEPLIGSLSGEGNGYDVKSPRGKLWLALGGAAELRAPLASSVFWHARLLALAPLIEQSFTVENAGPEQNAFVTPPVGGMMTLGVLVEL